MAEERMSLVLSGPINCGKTTAAERLQFELGDVERETGKPCPEADRLHRFAFALRIDRQKEERERGGAITCGTKHFCTDKRRYEIIDPHGHRDFITSMITGASQAHVAILLVPADALFVSAIASGSKAGAIQGPTRLQARLINLLGVKQLIVGINKMDGNATQYEQGRYNGIKEVMKSCLIQAGWRKTFVDKCVPFLPISGLNGDNVVKRSTCMPWWNGQDAQIGENSTQVVRITTLKEALDNAVCTSAEQNGAMCRFVRSRYKVKDVGYITAVRVETVEHQRRGNSRGGGIGLQVRSLNLDNLPRTGGVMVKNRVGFDDGTSLGPGLNHCVLPRPGPAPAPAPATVSAPPPGPVPPPAAAPPEAAQALQRVSMDSADNFESDTGAGGLPPQRGDESPPRAAGGQAGGVAGWRLDPHCRQWMNGFKATRQHFSVLSEELEAFRSFALTAHQGAAAILIKVRAAVAAVRSAAEATPGLAGALGVAVPQAPYEIDVSGLATADEVSALCCLLEADGYSVEHRPGGPGLGMVFIAGDAAAPLGCAALRLSPDAAVKATLCAEAVGAGEVHSVIQVLIHILWQSSLLEGLGGLTVPVLVAMVTTMRRGLPLTAPCDDAALLFATLSFYGSQFEPTKHMITLRGVRPLPPGFAPAKGGLWVYHPGDPAANLAASCRSFKRARRLFMHCSAALRRWDGATASAAGTSALASVVASNRLAAAYQGPAAAGLLQPQPRAVAQPGPWGPLADQLNLRRRREARIAHTKNSDMYKYYRETVTTRGPDDPSTPPSTPTSGRRTWEKKYGRWRNELYRRWWEAKHGLQLADVEASSSGEELAGVHSW